MVLDTVRARVFPSPDQVNHFQAVVQQFLLAKAPPVSLWRSLLGHLASLARLVPEFSAGLVGIGGVCDVRQLDSGCLSQEVQGHSFRISVGLIRDSSLVV
ncbi:hypothetical protein E2C01_054899 [Portunus trituberculatus]|uniref:Uncharacterized protein n=1 Tax=Portunus trituberculatus TaxID=210409 RepID=A0A5B7GKV2_PORTR|nr:hypothetical protein [Portunus trituberculatus]